MKHRRRFHRLAGKLVACLVACLVAWRIACLVICFVAWPAIDGGFCFAKDISANIHFRGSLDNSRVQFEKNRRGHVAFIGGSITEMNGYRPMVCEILRRRFPETQFTFTDAGIASTCSTTGAFRLQSDVLSTGPVDLFFVEFAVNDDQDAGHARRECIRGMEGIVRHALAHNPNMDLVITYFINPSMIETIQSGAAPISIGGHEIVSEYYRISSIDLAKEVTERIAAGTLTWEQYGGVHPAPLGNAICAGMIDDLMGLAWKEPLPREAEKVAHATPEKPLDPQNYDRGRFIAPGKATIRRGFEVYVPQWKQIPGGFRDRFNGLPMLCATEPGAELTLEFDGRAIGIYLLAGPDAGIVEASVDGGPMKAFDLFHHFSRGLHYPRTVVFDADLPPGKHLLTLRLTNKKNADSTGTAVRIMQFTAN